jgi:hypothetical protein
MKTDNEIYFEKLRQFTEHLSKMSEAAHELPVPDDGDDEHTT